MVSFSRNSQIVRACGLSFANSYLMSRTRSPTTGRNLPLQGRRFDYGVELGCSDKRDAVLKTVDAMFNAIERQQSAYERLFGVVPNFRVGIHGGDVVVSEQGDTKRSIGIYGDAINIAARMEDAAAARGVRCILSETVAEALANRDRIHEIGEEAVRGISAMVRVCEYRPRLDPIPIEHRTALTACTRRAGGSRYVQP